MYIQGTPSVFSYYNPLISYINQLIDVGYQSITMIKDSHRNELISLVMDALGNDQSYAIFDTDELNDNCNYFKNYLRSKSLNDLLKFQNLLIESAFKKYVDYLSNIFQYLNESRRAA